MANKPTRRPLPIAEVAARRKIPVHNNITTGGEVGTNFQPTTSNNTHPIKKVALFGHSYVRYFYIERQVYHPEFVLDRFAVPGGRVTSIR